MENNIYKNACLIHDLTTIGVKNRINFDAYLSSIEKEFGKVSDTDVKKYIIDSVKKMKDKTNNKFYILFCPEANYLMVYNKKHKTELEENEKLEDVVLNTLLKITNDDLAQIRDIRLNDDSSLSFLLVNNLYDESYSGDPDTITGYPFLVFGLLPYDEDVIKYYG